ncbi:MAG: hypothetical protein J6W29_04915 [Neisseriaceae bacterium]|nr:hypothetical protein [Neisseriaceae bacterium]
MNKDKLKKKVKTTSAYVIVILCITSLLSKNVEVKLLCNSINLIVAAIYFWGDFFIDKFYKNKRN